MQLSTYTTVAQSFLQFTSLISVNGSEISEHRAYISHVYYIVVEIDESTS